MQSIFLVFIFYVINTHLISLFANQTLPFISRIQYKKVKYIEGEMEQGLTLYPHNTDVSIPFVSTLESIVIYMMRKLSKMLMYL